jgi:hypothetical protein
VGLSIVLRIYFLQYWFNLPDSGAEEALYDSSTLRRFAGVDLGRAPDETTILNFRHLLERHYLCGSMLEAVNYCLEDCVLPGGLRHSHRHCHDCGRDHHSRAFRRPGTRPVRAPRRCTRRARATSGTRDEGAHRRGLE